MGEEEPLNAELTPKYFKKLERLIRDSSAGSQFQADCCGKQRGKQSHRDHFAGSRNFIILPDSGDKFSKP
jgi:hypothetical protein